MLAWTARRWRHSCHKTNAELYLTSLSGLAELTRWSSASGEGFAASGGCGGLRLVLSYRRRSVGQWNEGRTRSMDGGGVRGQQMRAGMRARFVQAF